MKKYFAILFFVIIFCFSGFPLNVFADEESSTSTKINARILPTIWYSTLSVNDGDSIKIYAGIQNNSGLNFTVTMTSVRTLSQVRSKIFDLRQLFVV